MLSQKRESRTCNVRFPKRVAVIDFSEYQEDGVPLGSGAGIAIYEWPALAAFNIILVAEACQMASSLATETIDDLGKAVKLALYGLHWKEHKYIAATYLKWVGNPLVSEVIALIDPQPDCLVAHIKKSGATYAIFDTPGSKNEKIYIHKVSNECCKTAQGKVSNKCCTAQGKTHAVYISDIAAYYAALLSAKQIIRFRAPDIDKRLDIKIKEGKLDMKIREVERILKNYPVRKIRCQGA
jgi:hypothetical protein